MTFLESTHSWYRLGLFLISTFLLLGTNTCQVGSVMPTLSVKKIKYALGEIPEITVTLENVDPQQRSVEIVTHAFEAKGISLQIQKSGNWADVPPTLSFSPNCDQFEVNEATPQTAVLSYGQKVSFPYTYITNDPSALTGIDFIRTGSGANVRIGATGVVIHYITDVTNCIVAEYPIDTLGTYQLSINWPIPGIEQGFYTNPVQFTITSPDKAAAQVSPESATSTADPNLICSGSSEFVDKCTQCLDRISGPANEAGLYFPAPVYIYERANQKSNSTTKMPAISYDGVDCQFACPPGSPSDCRGCPSTSIFWNSIQSSLEAPTEDTCLDECGTLAHELSHAAHGLNGTIVDQQMQCDTLWAHWVKFSFQYLHVGDQPPVFERDEINAVRFENLFRHRESLCCGRNNYVKMIQGLQTLCPIPDPMQLIPPNQLAWRTTSCCDAPPVIFDVAETAGTYPVYPTNLLCPGHPDCSSNVVGSAKAISGPSLEWNAHFTNPSGFGTTEVSGSASGLTYNATSDFEFHHPGLVLVPGAPLDSIFNLSDVRLWARSNRVLINREADYQMSINQTEPRSYNSFLSLRWGFLDVYTAHANYSKENYGSYSTGPGGSTIQTTQRNGLTYYHYYSKPEDWTDGPRQLYSQFDPLFNAPPTNGDAYVHGTYKVTADFLDGVPCCYQKGIAQCSQAAIAVGRYTPEK